MEGNGSISAPERPEELARRFDVDVVPTAPEESDLGRVRRARRLRRLFMAALATFLLAGATGNLGVRSRSTTVTGDGYELTVTYGQLSRGGLATPWNFEIRRPGGFDGPVMVAVRSDYLDMFDENGFDPEPTTSTADADEVIWEFEPPPGEVLSVSLDARIEPGVQWARRGWLSILEEGRPVVTARFRTWVMP